MMTFIRARRRFQIGNLRVELAWTEPIRCPVCQGEARVGFYFGGANGPDDRSSEYRCRADHRWTYRGVLTLGRWWWLRSWAERAELLPYRGDLAYDGVGQQIGGVE